MSKTNMASCAPAAPFISKSGQGLADRNFDHSLDFKSAQVGPYSFIAWNFDVVDLDETEDDYVFAHLRMGMLISYLCTA